MPTRPPTPTISTRSAAQSESLELIRVLIDGLSRSARTLERRTGITNAQLFLLQQLAESDGLSVNDLAERAGTQQSTVSVVVSRLVRAKLVRKTRSNTDARRTVLTLTTAAVRMLRNAPVPPATALLGALQQLSSSQAQSLADSLRALVGALGLSQQPGPLLFEPDATRSARTPRATRSK
ncbi:MAG: MarR family winged helix-turn-helix transcriptional regulator [bacterium]